MILVAHLQALRFMNIQYSLSRKLLLDGKKTINPPKIYIIFTTFEALLLR
jgi:hypothetical protein